MCCRFDWVNDRQSSVQRQSVAMFCTVNENILAHPRILQCFFFCFGNFCTVINTAKTCCKITWSIFGKKTTNFFERTKTLEFNFCLQKLLHCYMTKFFGAMIRMDLLLRKFSKPMTNFTFLYSVYGLFFFILKEKYKLTLSVLWTKQSFKIFGR